MKKTATILLGGTLLLAASPAPAQICCGDCNGSGQTTIDEIVDVVSGALGDCAYRTTVPLLATGQTVSYGDGSDGEIQAGVPSSYRDNGDGTITDLNTGLMWEKKDDSGGIHDRDDRYTWSAGDSTMSGAITTEFLSTLNGANGSQDCFAGYCDWRIPNLRELSSIVDFGRANPAIAPIFQGLGCNGCSDVTSVDCSCTSVTPYWTSTTVADPAFVSFAWTVIFNSYGAPRFTDKREDAPARAVRGGL